MKRFLFASIILCLSLLMATPAVNAQPIREKNKKGHPFLVLNQNQNVLHLKSYAGIGLYYFDGTTVRVSNAKGAPLYYIDVNTVRAVDKSGEPILYFDGLNIRDKNIDGAILYYLDGRVLRRGGEKGEPAYFFEVIPEKWILTCLVILDRM